MSNPLDFGFRHTYDSQTLETLALIQDLGLVPRNLAASEFYQILENDEIMRIRIECDMRALSNRNRCKNKDVLAPYGYNVSGTLEF